MGNENLGSQSQLISVIIPIYNIEKYLDNCIMSVVNQTYKNLEIILVDDGSLDNCGEICDNWGKSDSRIKILHKTNEGLSAARNDGINIAKGEYIAFVDGDDYIESDMYSEMINALSKYEADIVCCGRYRTEGEKDTKRKIEHCAAKDVIFNKESAIREILEGGYLEEAAWDKLYRRDLFDDIKFPVGEINEDVVTVIPLVSKCEKIVHIAKPLYNYRVRPGSITKTVSTEKLEIVLSHIYEVKKFVEEHYPQLEDSISIFFARYSISMMQGILESRKFLCDNYRLYYYYKKCLHDNIMSYMKDNKISWYEKTEAICLILGCYRIIRKVKRKF